MIYKYYVKFSYQKLTSLGFSFHRYNFLKLKYVPFNDILCVECMLLKAYYSLQNFKRKTNANELDNLASGRIMSETG